MRPVLLLFFSTVALFAEASFETIAMSSTLFVMLMMVAVLIAYRLRQLAKEVLTFQTLFAESPAAMIWIDANDRITAVNTTMQKLLGISLTELKGQIWYERILTPDAAVLARHKVYQQKTSENSTAFEDRYYRADAQTLHLSWQIKALSKKPLGSLLTATATSQ